MTVHAMIERRAPRGADLVVGAGDGVWSRGVAPDAVFEIGSISKTFTATLLASLVRDGVVALDDPVARHVPVPPPVRGRAITLEDLATHHSGLPRLPAGMLVQALTTERHEPYAGFVAARLRRAIAETAPKRAPGEKFGYSNYGYGLLGHALARAAGTSYAELLHERICEPLGLTRTGLDVEPLTPGHGALGCDVAWIILPDGTLTHDGGTGGFRSFAAVSGATVVVVLASTARSVNRLGMSVLQAATLNCAASSRSSAATSSGGANR